MIRTLAQNTSQKWTDEKTVIIEAQKVADIDQLKQVFSNESDVVSLHPIYKTVDAVSDGDEVGFTDEFLVQFLPNTSALTIDSLYKHYNVSVVKKTSFYYELKVGSKVDALDVANAFQESGFVKFSHPDFIVWPIFFQHIPNDTYFSQQWNFLNTGQTINDGHVGTAGADIKATYAWDITKGSSNITVAVLDEGVTSNHPDLPNTRQVRLNGSNFGDGNPNDPSPSGDYNHGNSCAGLIGATQDNNEGISGLAPGCKIMPIKIYNSDGTGITVSNLADAITFVYTNGADVLSNSWGFSSTNPNFQPAIVTAIQNATTLGRNHLGSVVVFAAGNTADHTTGSNGVINFPADVNVAGVITVGASDRTDHQADYSPTANPSSGQNQIIDVVAPSHKAYPLQMAGETFEVWSIDIPGAAGYNPWSAEGNVIPPPFGEILPSSGTNYYDYTGRFGGTSAACPQVAGLAALILSVDPTLTQQQVFNLITSHADKVGSYTYTSGASNEMGFGRINAYAAVAASIPKTAPSFTDPLPTPLCGGGTANFSINPVGYAVNYTYTITAHDADGNPVGVTFTANGLPNYTTTSTTVNLTLPHDNYWCTITARANFPDNQFSNVANHLFPNIYDPTYWAPTFTWNDCEPNGWDVSVTELPGATAYRWYEDGYLYDYTSSPESINGGMWNGEEVLTVEATACGIQSGLKADFIPCTYPNLAAKYTITPNPANTTITISGAQSQTYSKINRANIDTSANRPIKSIKVFDISGKCVFTKNLNNAQSNIQIDISKLPAGMYFMEISDGKKTIAEKVIVQH